MDRSTNLNLYLPGNSDYRDVTQLSYNFETIDDAIGTINGKIANLPNIANGNVTGTSSSAFETALTNATTGMAVGDVKACSCYANYSSSVTSGSQGIAFIYRVSESVWYVFIISVVGVKVGYMLNNTWTWL